MAKSVGQLDGSCNEMGVTVMCTKLFSDGGFISIDSGCMAAGKEDNPGNITILFSKVSLIVFRLGFGDVLFE